MTVGLLSAAAVDTEARQITLICMTLLQTRVDDKVASRFKLAARKRSLSPYKLLNELVTQTAAETSDGWAEHFARLRARKRTPLKENAAVEVLRDEP